MSRCACSFVRGLWSCIMGSLRMILFFGTLLLLLIALIQATTLFRLSHQGRIDQLPRTPMQMHVYAASAFSLIIALLGVFGSFYRHKTCLHLFSTLTIVHAVLVVGYILCTTSRGAIQDQNNRFKHELQDMRERYTWIGERPDPPHEDSNEIWDSLQWNAQCCGVDGPKDWDAYRPPNVAADLYPRSCCIPDEHIDIIDGYKPNDPRIDWDGSAREQQNKSHIVVPGGVYRGSLCQNDGTLFKVGCAKRVEQFEWGILILLGLMFSVQLPLALMACCVGNHAESGAANSAQVKSNSVLAGRIYVSAMPPPMHQSAASAPIYPNLYQGQQGANELAYQGAPPRYGSFE